MIHETIRIKSGAWDGNDIFYFSTLNHIKYCLTNGDHGIIRTLEVRPFPSFLPPRASPVATPGLTRSARPGNPAQVPVYISSCSNGTIHCLDREGKVRRFFLDLRTGPSPTLRSR